MFAETRAGIVYYDDAMNRSFVGTAAAPGGIATTITNAEQLGRAAGLFEHTLAPADLIAFDIVNQ